MKTNVVIMMILVAAGVAMVLPAWAFPTQAEIKTATDVVGDLVADDVRAANAGKAKRADVADKILALVDQAETDAAKWVLLKHAFIQYAKAYQFEKAGEVLTDMLSTFPDVPSKTLLAVIEKNAAKANAKNAPVIVKTRKLMYMRQKCSGIVANPKASKKEKAEAYCLMGDWTKGLKMLESLGGKTAEMAAAETNGKQPKHVIANYWWDYECALDTCDQFKAHAAEIYKAGLEDESIAGLYKNVAEKRIAEMEAVPQAAAVADKADNDELSKLKRICNTKGLVHCWRFNGTMKDEIGGSEAKLTGSAKLENGYVSKSGMSNIDLGENMLPKENNITLEFWARPNKLHPYARLFGFGCDKNNRLVATWIQNNKDDLTAEFEGRENTLKPAFGSYEMGVEYHLAVVIEPAGKNYKATTYRQDIKTGKTLSKQSMMIDNGWSPKAFEHKDSWLGASYWGDHSADDCYNEFRIWNRALSEKELTQNAIKFYKAGETIKKD